MSGYTSKNFTKNMFTGTVVPVDTSMFSNFVSGVIFSSNKSKVYNPITSGLIPNNLTILKTIYTEYSLNLAVKQYENIPTDPIHYSNLWMSLGNFQLPDITNTAPGSLSDGSVQLLVQITQDALHGASNASALYTRNRYDELKLVQLAQEEKDILSNKNQTSSLLMDDGSQFVATKTLLFSPLYSNYIFFMECQSMV